MLDLLAQVELYRKQDERVATALVPSGPVITPSLALLAPVTPTSPAVTSPAAVPSPRSHSAALLSAFRDPDHPLFSISPQSVTRPFALDSVFSFSDPIVPSLHPSRRSQLRDRSPSNTRKQSRDPSSSPSRSLRPQRSLGYTQEDSHSTITTHTVSSSLAESSQTGK